MKWEAFCGHELGKFEHYKDAVKAVCDEVAVALKEGRMSYLILETATWVVSDGLPIMFYEMRDNACDRGWIKDSKWCG